MTSLCSCTSLLRGPEKSCFQGDHWWFERYFRQNINFSMVLKGTQFLWFFILEQCHPRKPLSLFSVFSECCGFPGGGEGKSTKCPSLKPSFSVSWGCLTNLSPVVRMATCFCRNHHKAWFSQSSPLSPERPKMNNICQENEPSKERNGIIQHRSCLGFSLWWENCF